MNLCASWEKVIDLKIEKTSRIGPVLFFSKIFLISDGGENPVQVELFLFGIINSWTT